MCKLHSLTVIFSFCFSAFWFCYLACLCLILWIKGDLFFLFFPSFRKALQEESKANGNSAVFRLYMIIVGIYAGIQFVISVLMRIPACHQLTNQCDRWPLIRFVKWMRQVCMLNVYFESFRYFLFVFLTCCWFICLQILIIHFFWRNDTMLDVACMRALLIL